MSIRIEDLYPLQGRVAPGGVARYRLETHSDEPSDTVTVHVDILDLDELIDRAVLEVHVPAGDGTVDLAFRVPDEEARGYRVGVSLLRDGTVIAFGVSAVLVVSHWRLAPRYGFLSEFGPDETDDGRTEALARFHLTVVQFYDWMYRHHTFLPPTEPYEDAMGRPLSLERVREKVEGCHRSGMAALAYGAVYGAEPEYADAHPDTVLFDVSGRRHALIDMFTINDIRPGSAWRERILGEYVSAVDAVGFDGIHMDQYGTPKRAYDAEGTPVALDDFFPGLIDEAARLVSERREGAAVLFNAVNDWPMEAVASSNQAAVYIEVWPPHTRYRHLVELIRRARDLSGKQVVLAAYLEPFRTPGVPAEVAARFATAAIAVAGGHHLLLGEDGAVLRAPYYPDHGHLSPGGVAILRRYYDHTAFLHRRLFGPGVVDVTLSYFGGENAELEFYGATAAPEPEPGMVWVRVNHTDNDEWTLHFVNYLDQSDDYWNAPRQPPERVSGLQVRFGPWLHVRSAVWASPDDPSGVEEVDLVSETSGHTLVRLPALELWGTLVIRGDAVPRAGR